METLLIPPTDPLCAGWGWFMLLLLLTFPLHLLAMNAMVGGLVLGVGQHLLGGELRCRLAHRLAVATPMLVALTVNLGVAPYLFLQVLYGQFLYTSSILLGLSWMLLVPLLMLAYAGAYLYDFRFQRLGRLGPWIGAVCCGIFLLIAAILTSNMLLLELPARFDAYFAHLDGSLLMLGENSFPFRFLHMLLGALAVGGLAAALLGRFRAQDDPQLAEHAQRLGLRVFLLVTLANIVAGILYLLSLPRGQMLLFMGRDTGATIAFAAGLLLTAGVVVAAWRRRLWLTIAHTVPLVYLMVFLRSWLRAGALRDAFTLDRLQVMPQYSSLLLFVVVLVFGVLCLVWLWRKTSETLARS